MPAPKDWKLRFWEHVAKTGGCWTWTARLDRRGYGRLKVGHRYETSSRLSWLVHFGEIPGGLHVLHHCDNRACVRPDHLFLGTNAMNMRDRDRKGRNTRGERVPQHKVTENQVREMRRSFRDHRPRLSVLASQFGICKQTVSRILRGELWRHVAP